MSVDMAAILQSVDPSRVSLRTGSGSDRIHAWRYSKQKLLERGLKTLCQNSTCSTLDLNYAESVRKLEPRVASTLGCPAFSGNI
jgi:hypothetical protein